MNNQRRPILAIVLLMLAASCSHAQSGFDRSRLFFGGNFGVRFGNNTFVNLSPQVGYRIHERLTAGGGINCVASSLTFRTPAGERVSRERFGYAGLNVFGRFFPLSSVFLSLQPEYNYSWGNIRYFNGQPDEKSPAAYVPCLLVGAGTVIPSGRGTLIAMLQYDVAGSARSPYGRNPFVTFGFNF